MYSQIFVWILLQDCETSGSGSNLCVGSLVQNHALELGLEPAEHKPSVRQPLSLQTTQHKMNNTLVLIDILKTEAGKVSSQLSMQHSIKC